ncbi:uncharacterized protein LOC110111925, partial [Dendrobium catenatum]|uniref:uncharacterized protein LOC110111925 n=1 Tax=Dendrobium catenatum TaxID=906689 RepID=UPI0010A031B3
MSGTAKEGGTTRQVTDMQLVAAIPNSVGAVVAKAGTGDGSIVEYGKGAGGGSVLREEEEDLEVKLRRIIENVPVRVSNTSGSSAGSGSGDFHQKILLLVLDSLSVRMQVGLKDQIWLLEKGM